MNNIYFNSPYSSSNTYNLNDYIGYSGYFRGTIPVNPSGFLYANQNSITSTFDDTKWEGYVLDNGDTKPNFTWIPSYQNTVNNQPRVQVLKFGDGYESRVPDGINVVLPIYNLRFENRDVNEATAILHFLSQRQGAESFIWNGRPPYQRQLRYVCREWNDTQNFDNNFTIEAKFEQVVN